MESLERLGYKRHGAVRFVYVNGKRIPVYEGKVSSKAKSAIKNKLKKNGQDARFQKIGPKEWAVWTKDLPAGDINKFKPRFDQATGYKHARAMGPVAIPAHDIKMKEVKSKKTGKRLRFEPIDPQIKKLMKKEKARVDATGKRIILPMKREVYGRRAKPRKTQHRRVTHRRKDPLRYVWPFSLRK